MKSLNSKLFTLVFLVMANVGVNNAQIFHKKDSVRTKSIFQAELGAFLGIYEIKPATTAGYIYFNSDGYDRGYVLNFITNITKQVSFSIGLRKSEQTCMIGIANDAFLDSFHLTIESEQYPFALNYHVNRKQKNLFSIMVGGSFRKCKYKTSNGQYRQYIGTMGTNSGDQLINEKTIEYTNFLFGISKSISLCKKIQLKPFIEYEIYSQPLIKENYFKYSNEWKEYYTSFKQSNYRIGLSFVFN